MKVVFASSEAVPWSKTGGLADVAGALPRELAALGHDVTVFTPYYRETRAKNFPVEDTGQEVRISLVRETVTGRILRAADAPAGVDAFLVDAPAFFDREGLYQSGGEDHPDNSSRFVFFTRAVLESLEPLDVEPDVFHVHDWQTALLPVYLETLYGDRAFSRAGTLLTIHNLGYQGLFPAEEFDLTGLPPSVFDWRSLEFYGKLNFLKCGIVHAGLVNTVSRTYAREILGEEQGMGLDGVLRDRSEDLYGVVNGIDTDVWNPETDPLIPARFSRDSLDGKALCREELRKRAGLRKGREPIFGMITRLAPQKGVDLVTDEIADLLAFGLKLVVLGTGDPEYHDALERAQKEHKGRVGAFLAFDNSLAHLIEAGADAFLMPSRYEPCGLNQMMSMRYGTVPVVRRTGGLADTVTDASPHAVREGAATGFVFDDADVVSLHGAAARATAAFRDAGRWRGIAVNGMSIDWSWSRTASEYSDLYAKAAAKRG